MDFLTVMSSGEGASAASNYISTAIAGMNFMSVFDEVLSLLPVMLPVIVAFIGFRKGLRFLIGSLKRA